MLIREIEERDNEQVESLIRTCLIEFGANKPGCAWEDPNLGCFYEVYQNQKAGASLRNFKSHITITLFTKKFSF